MQDGIFYLLSEHLCLNDSPFKMEGFNFGGNGYTIAQALLWCWCLVSSHSLNDCSQSVLTYGLPWSGPEALELGAWDWTACLGENGSVFQATAPGKSGTFLKVFFIAIVQKIVIPHCFSPIRPRIEQPLVSHSLRLVPLALSSSNYTGTDLSHLLPIFLFSIPVTESASFLQWTLVLSKPHLNAILGISWDYFIPLIWVWFPNWAGSFLHRVHMCVVSMNMPVSGTLVCLTIGS